MRWTEDQLNEYLAKSKATAMKYIDDGTPITELELSKPAPIIPESTMNKTEQKFADYCEIQKNIKKIIDYRYEPCRLILSPNVKGGRNAVSYQPDFLVIHPTHFEFVEVKAKSGKWTSMRDDARAKINIAASMFPWFRFTVAYYEKGEWSFERL